MFILLAVQSPSTERGFENITEDVLHADFCVTACRKAETLQRINSLWRGVDDIDQTLVDAHLERFTALFVYVRALDDREGALACRQWYRTGDTRACTKRCINDLFC